MSRASGELGLELPWHCSCSCQQTQQKPCGQITEGMLDRTLGTLWCPILMASRDDTTLGCHMLLSYKLSLPGSGSMSKGRIFHLVSQDAED